MTNKTLFSSGWYQPAKHRASSFFNTRPDEYKDNINLLVVHNISLPSENFTTNCVDDLFMGCLDVTIDPSFASLRGVEVSAHFFIRRDGELFQYVSCQERAWHAGVSSWQGIDGCNDYSIGIELEGTDELAYEPEQYAQLEILTSDLCAEYSIPLENIVGHCDIAPERKTDPGTSFDWLSFRANLARKKA